MTIASEYVRLRRLGWAASQAYDAAKVRDQTDRAASDGGPVRMRIEPDSEPYEYGDCSDTERHAIDRRIAMDGVWGIIGEVWDGHEWQHVDSCWGFIGDDWRNSGYDTDIMRATLDALYSQPEPSAHDPP
jgi:hypothetical protein